MEMNEAKELLESSKDVRVTYGVPFKNLYVFGFKDKNGEVPLIGGLYTVNKDTKEIGVFNPINYSASEYAEYNKFFAANVTYYTKDAFDMPTPVQNA